MCSISAKPGGRHATLNKPVTKETDTGWFHLHKGLGIVRLRHRGDCGYKGLGGGERGALFNGAECQFYRMKEFWRWMVVMVSQQCEFS